MTRLLAVALACACAAGCAPKPGPRPAVQSTAVPGRIVSIAPSVTEMLFAVGAGSRVVATDDYSNYPAEAAALPRVGGMALNYERIVALKPDLVIGVSDLQGASLDRLGKLGIRTLRLDTTSYAKTVSAIRTVGGATGYAIGAERVAGRMEDALRAARRPGIRRFHRILVVVEASPKLFVAGKGTFFDGMLESVGVANAAETAGFQMISLEGLIALKPDLVVTTTAADTATVSGLLSRAHLKTPVVTAPQDSFVRPGPRLADGLAWLSKAVREPVASR
ncbi:MAG TPA: helical backbone metal receptor [Armatimonadota bacterium]|jgi:iron complex transport system substrate-binding protein